mmetsp:Transcript_42604/g.78773  ORF Transcript_42604/g.78773 Transcript_42604/m.78773 type:complete len:224 (+) Transcript_42604:322-993(+)
MQTLGFSRRDVLCTTRSAMRTSGEQTAMLPPDLRDLCLCASSQRGDGGQIHQARIRRQRREGVIAQLSELGLGSGARAPQAQELLHGNVLVHAGNDRVGRLVLRGDGSRGCGPGDEAGGQVGSLLRRRRLLSLHDGRHCRGGRSRRGHRSHRSRSRWSGHEVRQRIRNVELGNERGRRHQRSGLHRQDRLEDRLGKGRGRLRRRRRRDGRHWCRKRCLRSGYW